MIKVERQGPRLDFVIDTAAKGMSRAVPRIAKQVAVLAQGPLRESIVATMKEGGRWAKGRLARSVTTSAIESSNPDAKRTTKVYGFRTGSRLVYARIQDQGGIIRPRTVRHLAVPTRNLGARMRSRWPRDWPRGELFLIPAVGPRAGKDPLLARKVRDKIQVLYVLKKQVTIPAKDYTGKALDKGGPLLARFAEDQFAAAAEQAAQKAREAGRAQPR